jgi:hypothetical protein
MITSAYVRSWKAVAILCSTLTASGNQNTVMGNALVINRFIYTRKNHFPLISCYKMLVQLPSQPI